MLAPSNDFGYSPAASHHQYAPQQQQQQQQSHHQPQMQQHHGIQHHHQHSGERPKIYGLENHHAATGGMNGLIHHNAIHDYQQMIHSTPQHHSMTPQQSHQQHQQSQQHHQGDFDHEPLMMSMHNPAVHYSYPPMGVGQMLHVSADYPPQAPASVANSTPSSGSKRSREELNMKEKKRMFKLNDRINQLKDMLDEAGVQCKKNKQSILDNTAHYVGMLRSNLLIAQQKAERAEKQVDIFRAQAQQKNSSMGASATGGGADLVFKRCFDQSTTARLVMDLSMQPVTYNHAFLNHTGLNEQSMKKKELLRQFLCLDAYKLDAVVTGATEQLKATSAIVQARTAHGEATLTLMASVITDEFGKAVNLEFSLIPFEISSELQSPVPSSSQQQQMQQQSYHHAMGMMTKREIQESSPSGVSDLAV
ncbi:DNA binding protein [Globisporangium polare]